MPTGPGGVWIPDPNPLLGIAQTVGQINQNKLFPLQYQQQQLQNQTSQLGLSNVGVSNLASDVASVPANPKLADDPAVIAARAMRVAAGLEAGRYGPNGQAIAAAYAGDGGFTDAKARQFAIQTGSATEGGAQGIPTISYQDTGPNIQGVATNPVQGTAAPVGAPIAKGPSPEFMAGYVAVKRGDGSVINVPRSVLEDPMTGRGRPNVMGPDGKPLTDAYGAVLGALPAGQEGALASNVQNQQDRANALQTAFDNGSGNTSAQRKAMLEELRQMQGDFRSGPNAAKWSGIVTEFDRIFGTHFADSGASDQQIFGKIAQQIASAQRDTLGLPATNAGEAAAEIAAPNSAYSPKANLALIAQLEGNEDLLQKKQAAWTAYSKKGGTYNGFASQFNRTFDPRFFWDQYAPQATQATSGMTPAQAAEYQRRAKAAMSLKF